MVTRVDEHLTTRKFALSDYLEAWKEAFLIDRRAQNLSSKTIEFYHYTLLNFSRFCELRAITMLDQVTPDELRRYLLWLAETGHNEHGIHAYWRGVRAFIRWLWDETDQDGKPPTDKVKSPRMPKELLDPVDLEEVQALLNTCKGSGFYDSRDHAILLTLLDTGVRARELLALDLDDIDNSGAVVVQRGKGAKGRTVYIGQQTRKAIRGYMRTRADDNPAVFVSEQGERLTYSGLRLMIQRRAAKAGIPAPEIHSFRRTFALESLRAGIDVFALQSILGHADLSTVRRYVKQTSGDLQAAHGRTSPVAKLRGGRRK